MSFSNPPLPWAEMSRILAGLPPADDPHGRTSDVRLGSGRTGPHDANPDDPDPDDPDPGAGGESTGPSGIPPGRRASYRVPYAELHCHSAFSFLDGASTPEQLVGEAVALGLDALALTDHDGFYGVVPFADAAKDAGLKTIYGAELSLGLPAPQAGQPDPAGEHLLVLVRRQGGYHRLSRQISAAHLAGGEKGRPVYDVDTLADAADGHWLILTGCRKSAVRRALAAPGPEGGISAAERQLRALLDRFGADNVAVELTTRLAPGDDETNDALAALAGKLHLPTVATTGAHYATPAEGRLAAAVAAVRARRSLGGIDPYLPAAATAHLRSGAEMAQLFARYPGAVRTAAEIGADIAFDLHLIAPDLPPFDVPPGYDEASYLREITMAGAARRYGSPETNPDAYAQLERELGIITDQHFPGYFLIVWDIVRFCQREKIMCQGRGSAANSAVCYALGITAVDAVGYGLLFERFLSPVRQGPPDIDVDIEARRREEVIQYVYDTYGRDKAAQVANVATYRAKMAVRDMAAALGHSPGQRDAYAKQFSRWSRMDGRNAWREEQQDPTGRTEAGRTETGRTETGRTETGRTETGRTQSGTADQPGAADQPDEPDVPADVLDLAGQISGFPRHLGIHSGGMVICDRPVAEVCPVEWARKEGRSVLQWDKDDCASIGLVKFDLLGLGMLSALHETLDLVREHEGRDIDLAALDLEEPAVYDMLCRADAVGVFQVESRAQLATLPRLKPRRFYDLVIEIALIRPGPIQGGSVHPYLARRDAVRAKCWPKKTPFVDHPAMERSLGKTLGIPLFQEQLMELAIDVAGFNAEQADQLRRAMGSKRSTEKMQRLKQALYDGMRETNGITGDLADSIFERLEAFANFGFAESHALSFASLVFHSAHLKLHHPAAFLVGLLRAQPMGFYSPQSLVADARRHGVTVHRAHVNSSGARADLEPGPDGRPAARLGLSGIRSIGTDLAEAIVAGRPEQGYSSITAVALAARRAGQHITAAQIETLATAGALDGLAGVVCDGDGGRHKKYDGSRRRAALWAAGPAAAAREDMLPVSELAAPALPGMSDLELTLADIWATGISPDTYPTVFSRQTLTRLGAITAAEVGRTPAGTRVHLAGIVTHRQRPATAGGVIFLNIEDETGMVNVVCSPGMWQRHRGAVRAARSLIVRGIVECDRGVVNLVADRMAIIDIAGALPSRDFR